MSYTYLSALWWEIGGDVDARCRSGCQTILLDYGYRERAPENEPVARFGSLREAADWILRRERKGQV
jgi:hypothetical protein